jgi:hypothetical protein
VPPVLLRLEAFSNDYNRVILLLAWPLLEYSSVTSLERHFLLISIECYSLYSCCIDRREEIDCLIIYSIANVMFADRARPIRSQPLVNARFVESVQTRERLAHTSSLEGFQANTTRPTIFGQLVGI